MIRGKIAEAGYRPQFSGHETFPMRYGWLKKGFDAVHETEDDESEKNVFLSDDAIARFGVGKNMVTSIRHWSQVVGILEDGKGGNQLKTTPLGKKLFMKNGLDPYMESPSTLWLIHWLISGRPEKTTWHWAFNYYPNLIFDREHLVRGLEKLVLEREWGKISGATIKRDVECFVRTYVPKSLSPKASFEEALESPLTELGLIKSVGRREGFRFVRGPKTSLGKGVFLYALVDFWKGFSSARSLSFEAIAREPGSPGRVFLLDENDLADRLIQLEQDSKGQFRWSETAGMKQVFRNSELDLHEALRFINEDF